MTLHLFPFPLRIPKCIYVSVKSENRKRTDGTPRPPGSEGAACHRHLTTRGIARGYNLRTPPTTHKKR